MFHYLYFVSDILVVSYVLSCAEPTESDSNSAYSAGAVTACCMCGRLPFGSHPSHIRL